LTAPCTSAAGIRSATLDTTGKKGPDRLWTILSARHLTFGPTDGDFLAIALTGSNVLRAWSLPAARAYTSAPSSPSAHVRYIAKPPDRVVLPLRRGMSTYRFVMIRAHTPGWTSRTQPNTGAITYATCHGSGT